MAERWDSHHGPVLNDYLAVAAVGRSPASTSSARWQAVWGGVGRKPDRARIPFARDPAFELNTR
jgi:hypothetical protein